MKKVFCAADLLLPQPEDMAVWPALACDQFTSEPQYWQKAEQLTQGKPSTLHITLPEVYLEQADVPARIKQIHAEMQTYKNSILTRKIRGFIYVRRTTESGTRSGLVGTVDLEAYEYTAGSRPLVRPSENTVVDRIPPRLAVRRGASLETPHILMLLDDASRTIIEPFAAKTNELPLVYDQDLMLGGGHIAGYAITDDATIAAVEDAVATLGTQNSFDAAYPAAAGQPPLAVAVGDGNHSLATAKAYWEEVKATLALSEQATHPTRYALVELVNVHDTAIGIEPIHRAVFGTEYAVFAAAFAAFLKEKGAADAKGEKDAQTFTLTDGFANQVLQADSAVHPLAVGTLEAFLAVFCAQNPGVKVDYIHGIASLRSICQTQRAIGVILPDFAKSDVFRGVVLGGVLPKKTFSMGHAEEKRYYMECRAITL